MPLATVDIGKSEKTVGLSLVALSRTRSLQHMLINPFTFDRIGNIGRSLSHKDQVAEIARLDIDDRANELATAIER